MKWWLIFNIVALFNGQNSEAHGPFQFQHQCQDYQMTLSIEDQKQTICAYLDIGAPIKEINQ